MRRILTYQMKPLTAFLVVLLGGALLSWGLLGALKVTSSSSMVPQRDLASPLAVVLVDGFQCSAFRVGPSSFVTAAHCFEGVDPSAPVMVILAPFGPSSGPVCQARSVKVAPLFASRGVDWDMAALNVDPYCAQGAPGRYYSLEVFDPSLSLGCLGYPGAEDFTLYSSYGKVHRSFLPTLNGSSKAVPTTLSTQPGVSGSVVFDASHPLSAVGLVSSARADGATVISAFDREKLELLTSWIAELDPSSSNASLPGLVVGP